MNWVVLRARPGAHRRCPPFGVSASIQPGRSRSTSGCLGCNLPRAPRSAFLPRASSPFSRSISGRNDVTTALGTPAAFQVGGGETMFTSHHAAAGALGFVGGMFGGGENFGGGMGGGDFFGGGNFSSGSDGN